MSLPDSCLDKITSIVNDLIDNKLDVFCKEIPLEETRSVPGLVTLQDEVWSLSHLYYRNCIFIDHLSCNNIRTATVMFNYRLLKEPAVVTLITHERLTKTSPLQSKLFNSGRVQLLHRLLIAN